MDIAERLKVLREGAGLSKGELGRRAGLSESYIGQIESKKKRPTVDTIFRICEGLGITVQEFFSIDQDISAIPTDILELVSTSENYGLLRQIIILKKEGYSNEVIMEWLHSLNKALTDIKKKGVFVVGEYLPGDRKYTEQEEQEIAEKLSEKLNDPNFVPPWRK